MTTRIPSAASEAGAPAHREGETATSPFGTAYLLVSLALVSLVTIIAFEGMAISTAMPAAAKELGAVRSYGLAFSVMLTTQLLGIVLAGVWCDRAGPLQPLYAGQLLMALGSGLCGASHGFGIFLCGRGVAGLGAGLIIVALYVVIGRAYPDALRPKVFSVISAAWVLPALVGPPIAAWLTTTFSWRWVFWAVVIPIVITSVILTGRRQQIRSEDDKVNTSGRDRHEHVRAAWLGLFIATAAGAVQWGTHDLSFHWSAATGVAVAGVLGIGVVAPLLLPRGTWLMARGLPSVMISRFLLTSSFFGTVTYVPLMLVNERHLTLGVAGAVVAIGSLGWSLGAWVQGRDRFNGHRDRLVSTGGLFLAAGLAVLTLVVAQHWPVWLVAVALTSCGIGMGLAMTSVSVLSLALTAPEEHGHVSSSLQLADVLGSVLGIAATGAVFAALHTRAGEDAHVYVSMWTGLSVVAALVALAGQRIRT